MYHEIQGCPGRVSTFIFVVVKHPVRPEFADDWLSLVQGFTAATGSEPGDICFEWYRSADDPNLWLLVEGFRDGEAGPAHVGSAHFQDAIAKFPQWRREVPEIVHVDAPGDGWSRMTEIDVERKEVRDRVAWCRSAPGWMQSSSMQ